jgi:hypothetical protein
MSPKLHCAKKLNDINPPSHKNTSVNSRTNNQIYRRPGTACFSKIRNTITLHRNSTPDLLKTTRGENQDNATPNTQYGQKGCLNRPQSSVRRRHLVKSPCTGTSTKSRKSLHNRPGTAPICCGRKTLTHSDKKHISSRQQKYELLRKQQAAKEARRAEVYAINRVMRNAFYAEFSAQMEKGKQKENS